MQFGRRVGAFYIAARVTDDGLMGWPFSDAFGRVREFATVPALALALESAGEDLAAWEVWARRSSNGWVWERVGSLAVARAGDPS